MFQAPKMVATAMVGQCRPLQNKDKQIWAYSVQLVCMGLTLETTTKDEKMYTSIASKQGQPVSVTCGLELYNGNLKLSLQDFQTLAGAAASAADQVKPAAGANGRLAGSPA